MSSVNRTDVLARSGCAVISLGVRPMLATVESVLRGLPLFFSARPATALRVLCIMAFNALHIVRHGAPLTTAQARLMATLLDLGALANAQLDGKYCCRRERHAILQLLRRSGMAPAVAEYLRRLKTLERKRPSADGEPARFDEVRLYREAVVRLSLAMLASSIGGKSLDDQIQATHSDAGLRAMFQIAMQCQIMDDVLDYRSDVASGLPTFLTASSSLAEAFERARLAAGDYAGDHEGPLGDAGPMLRVPLWLVSACARLSILIGRGRELRPEAEISRSRASYG